MVASGLSIGSDADSIVTELGVKASLMESLIREPLNPTKETPAITVMRDIHLSNKISLKETVLTKYSTGITKDDDEGK